ncbi:MAG: CcmD family protein [Deltaproteobacteria bacterium]|nr:CcmD family protein [Deltaproteobacteria bacterium]
MKHALRRIVSALATLIVTFLVAAPALAAATDEFVDFDPAKATKSVSAPLFVVIAYAAIWLVVVFFAVIIFQKQRSIRAELDEAQARLEAVSSDHDKAPSS